MPISKLIDEQVVALARIVSDIVMADDIIDVKEIERFSQLFANYDDRILFYKARQQTLSQAVKKLTGNSIENKANIKKLIEDVAACDGISSPAEAKLLLGLNYYFLHNNTIRQANRSIPHYEIKSFQLTDLYIGHRFVIYIESEYSRHNFSLEKNYSLISNLLAGIGFQFIYIPELVKLYKQRERPTFRSMAKYLFPDIDEQRVDQAYDKILSMTTREFVQKHMSKQMGFSLNKTGPALLVMLGHDTVLSNNMTSKGLSYDTYANMLKINIPEKEEEDILTTFTNFVKDYNDIVSFNHFTDFNPSHNKLLYQGMYKVFFNLVVLAQEDPDRPRIDIVTHGKNSGVYINRRRLNLQLGQAAVYTLILHNSMFGDKTGLPKKSHTEAETKSCMQQKYQRIVALMSNTPTTNKACIYNRLSVHVSEIQGAIREISSRDLFLKQTDSHYLANVDADCVYVDEAPIESLPGWSNL